MNRALDDIPSDQITRSLLDHLVFNNSFKRCKIWWENEFNENSYVS